MDYYKCERCNKVFDEFEMNYRDAQIDKKCWCRACRDAAQHGTLEQSTRGKEMINMADNKQLGMFASSDNAPRFYVKAERNSKGYNVEASVVNAIDADFALNKLEEMMVQLEARYPRETPKSV